MEQGYELIGRLLEQYSDDRDMILKITTLMRNIAKIISGSEEAEPFVDSLLDLFQKYQYSDNEVITNVLWGIVNLISGDDKKKALLSSKGAIIKLLNFSSIDTGNSNLVYLILSLLAKKRQSRIEISEHDGIIQAFKFIENSKDNIVEYPFKFIERMCLNKESRNSAVFKCKEGIVYLLNLMSKKPEVPWIQQSVTKIFGRLVRDDDEDVSSNMRLILKQNQGISTLVTSMNAYQNYKLLKSRICEILNALFTEGPVTKDGRNESGDLSSSEDNHEEEDEEKSNSSGDDSSDSYYESESSSSSSSSSEEDDSSQSSDEQEETPDETDLKSEFLPVFTVPVVASGHVSNEEDLESTTEDMNRHEDTEELPTDESKEEPEIPTSSDDVNKHEDNTEESLIDEPNQDDSESANSDDVHKREDAEEAPLDESVQDEPASATSDDVNKHEDAKELSIQEDTHNVSDELETPIGPVSVVPQKEIEVAIESKVSTDKHNGKEQASEMDSPSDISNTKQSSKISSLIRKFTGTDSNETDTNVSKCISNTKEDTYSSPKDSPIVQQNEEEDPKKKIRGIFSFWKEKETKLNIKHA